MADPVPGSVEVPLSGSFSSIRVLHQIVNPDEPGDGVPSQYTFGFIRFVDGNGVPAPVDNAAITLHPNLTLVDFAGSDQDPSYWRLRLWHGEDGKAYPALLLAANAQQPSSLTLVVRDAVEDAPHIFSQFVAEVGGGVEYDLVAFIAGQDVPLVAAGAL